MQIIDQLDLRIATQLQCGGFPVARMGLKFPSHDETVDPVWANRVARGFPDRSISPYHPPQSARMYICAFITAAENSRDKYT